MITTKISVAHDLMHVQLLIQKLKVLLKSLFMNISRNVATIRRTSCIRFKLMNTDDLHFSPAALSSSLGANNTVMSKLYYHSI